jgi:WD40 repeat protein
VTLKRGDVKIATIVRVPPPPPVAKPEPQEVTIEPLHRIRGTSGMEHLTISPDGRYFVVAGADHPGISVFETQSGKRILSIALWRKRGALARFSPDSTQLITCEVWTDLRIYDLATGRQVRAFDTGEHMFFFWPPAGARLLYRAPEKTQVWDWTTGKKLCDLPSLDTGNPAYLTPDGLHVFQHSNEKPHIRVLDASTGKEVDAYPQLRGLPFGPISSDGKRLLSWDGPKVSEYDVATGKQVGVADVGSDKRIAYSGDNHRLLTVAKARDECRLLDVRTGKLLAVLHFPEPVDPSWSTGALSDDGRYAVVVGPADSTYVFRLPDAPADKGNR